MSSSTIGGLFNATNGALFGGATSTSFAVTGSTTLSSTLNLGGALNANGGGSFSGTFSGNHTLSGLVTLSGGFFSSASSTQSGSLFSTLNNYLASSTLAGNTLFTNATGTALSLTGSTTIGGLFNATNGALFGGATSTSLAVNGSTTISSILNVSGDALFAGNVGIKKTPTVPLDVNGIVNSDGTLSNSFTTSYRQTGWDTSGSFSYSGTDGFGLTLGGYRTNQWTSLGLFTNGSERLHIGFAGDVGIGTTSPSARLAVHALNGDTDTTLFAIASSTASATTTLFSIANTGNVGVGTANPGNTLQVVTPTQFKGYSLSNGSNVTAELIGLTGSNDDGALKLYSGGINGTQIVGSGTSYFNGGNVGVGSTSPYAKLSINTNPTDLTINTTLFAIGSSTASATTTLFSIGNTGQLTLTSSATSTISGGLIISSGGLQVSTLTAAGCTLKTDGSGNVFCGTDNTSAGGANPFAWSNNYGLIAAATTSALWIQNSLFASTTATYDAIVLGMSHLATTTYAYAENLVANNPYIYKQYASIGASVTNPIANTNTVPYSMLDITGVITQNNNESAQYTGYITPFTVNTITQGSGNIAGIQGISSNPVYTGTATFSDGIYGFVASPAIRGGTVPFYTGYLDFPEFSAGIIPAQRSFVADQGSTTQGTARVGTSVGFQSDDRTNGTSSNYAFLSYENASSTANGVNPASWAFYGGGSAPSYLGGALYVSGTGKSIDVSGPNNAILDVNGTLNSTYEYSDAVRGAPTVAPTSTLLSYRDFKGGNFTPYSTSNNLANAGLVGVAGYPYYQGTGWVLNSIAGYFKTNNVSTGSTTNSYGVQIDTPANSGGGGITNNYGLYIANQAGVATSTNYSIYSAGGNNYFAGNVGIGSTSPTEQLDIQSNGFTGETITSFSNTAYPYYNVQRFRGTAAARSYPNSGDTLGSYAFVGGDNTAAEIVSYADENQSTTKAGANLNFFTTPNGGSVTRYNRLTITSAGNLGLGTTTPFGKFGVLLSSNDTAYPGNNAFVIASSTASATTTLFSISNTGTTTLGRFGACSGTSALTTDSSGNIVCGVLSVSGGVGNWFTPTTAFGPAANATSTLIGFTNGLYALASSTIGGGSAASGLTISGNATTTGNTTILGSLAVGTTTGFLANSNAGNLLLYNTNTSGASPALIIGGNVGGDTDFWIGRTNNNDTADNDSLSIGRGLTPGTTPFAAFDYTQRFGVGSSSPFAKLSINGNPTDTTLSTTLFAIGSSTASATTTLFKLDNKGNILVGTSSDSVYGSTNQLAKLTIDTTASSTQNAINAYGLTNDFFEYNCQNFSTGAAAQCGYAATRNDGSLTTGFTWLGINNTNFNNASAFNIGNQGDGNILSDANDFWIGQGTAGKNLYITNGGVGTSSIALTISTTNNNVGVSTTSPFAKFAIQAGALDTNTVLFAIGSSTATASTSLLTVDNTGLATLTKLNVTAGATTSALSITGSTTVGGVLNVGGNLNANGGGSLSGTFSGNHTLSGLVTLSGGFFSSASSTLSGSFFSTLSNYLASSTLSGNTLFTNATGTTLAITGSTTIASQFNATNGANFGPTTHFGTAAFNSNVGLGTSSPYANLSIAQNASSTNQTIFAIASTTNTGGVFSTTTLLSISNTGSTTLAGPLGVTSSATSTFAQGLNITAGCFAINGTCVGGSGNGTVNSGTQGQAAFYNAGGTAVSGTSTVFINTNSQVGVGTSSPWAKLSIDTSSLSATAGEFAIGSSSRSDIVVNQLGEVGVGTSSPWARLSIDTSNLPANVAAFAVGSTTRSDFVITQAGNTGLGTTSPFAKLSLTNGVSTGQVAVAFDATNYTLFSTNATGDLNVVPSGNDTFLPNSNLWVCTGGTISSNACPTGTPTGQGNLVVQNKEGIGTTTLNAKLVIETQDSTTDLLQIASTTAQNLFVVKASGYLGVGSTTPFARLSVGSNGAITTTENGLTDGATIAVNWLSGNQQRVTLGGNRTITFSSYVSGQVLRLVLCQDGTGSRTITSWDSAILWSGGSAPTLTATANKCDILAFIATQATSTLKVFGSTVLNF